MSFLACVLAIFVEGAPLLASEKAPVNTLVYAGSSPPLVNGAPFADQAVSCGPRAVYLLLGMCGVSIERGSLDFSVENPEGASLLELKQLCLLQGLPVQVLRSSDGALDSWMGLPWIARVKSSFNAGQVTEAHYIVVYRVDRDFVHALDGVSGRARRHSHEAFSDLWLGQAIVPMMQGTSLSNVKQEMLLWVGLLAFLSFGLISQSWRFLRISGWF